MFALYVENTADAARTNGRKDFFEYRRQLALGTNTDSQFFYSGFEWQGGLFWEIFDEPRTNAAPLSKYDDYEWVDTEIVDVKIGFPRELPDFNSLCKNRGSFPVLLECDYSIVIAPATFIGKKVVFGKKNNGGVSVIRYGQLAWDLHKAVFEEKKHPSDEEFLLLVLEALKYNYRVTPEVINQYNLISSKDIQPIILAAWNARDQEEQKKTSDLTEQN